MTREVTKGDRSNDHWVVTVYGPDDEDGAPTVEETINFFSKAQNSAAVLQQYDQFRAGRNNPPPPRQPPTRAQKNDFAVRRLENLTGLTIEELRVLLVTG